MAAQALWVFGPYSRFAGVKRHPKEQSNWRDDGSLEYLGHLVVIVVFVLGIGMWTASRGIFNEEAIWLILMGLATLGMRVGSLDVRRELAERKKQDWKDKHDETSIQAHIIQ